MLRIVGIAKEVLRRIWKGQDLASLGSLYGSHFVDTDNSILFSGSLFFLPTSHGTTVIFILKQANYM